MPLPAPSFRTLLPALALAVLAACAEDAPVESYVTPALGQTGVNRTAPLVVRAAELDVPPDYPTTELVRVIDLFDGGFVAGEVRVTETTITFEPASAWSANRRYLWIVAPPDAVPHGPELPLPEELAGENPFETDSRLNPLAVGRDDNDRLCFVMSRPVDPERDLGVPTVFVGDEELPVELPLQPLDDEAWRPDLPLAEDDAGLGVGCIGGSAGTALPNDAVRFQWSSRRSWLFELSDRSLTQLALDQHRGS